MIREIKCNIDWTLAFLIGLPLFYISGQDLREVQQYFFQTATVVLVGLFHANRYVGLFLLYCAAQFIFMPQVDSLTIQNILFGAIIYQFVLKMSDIKMYPRYFKALLAVLVINMVWCALQAWQLDPIFRMQDTFNQVIITEPSGFWGLPAFLGNFVAAVAPLLLFVSWLSFPLILGGIVLSKSSFSLVACGASVAFFLWFKNRIVFYVIAALIVIGGSFYVLKYDLPTGQFGKRSQIWTIVARKAFAKQVFGYGTGTYGKSILMEVFPSGNMIFTDKQENAIKFLRDEMKRLGRNDVVDFIENLKGEINGYGFSRYLQEKFDVDYKIWNYVHNDFLQAFYEGGIFAILILGAFIFDIFRRFYLFGRKNMVCVALCASFIAMLVVSVGHFPFHLARLAGIYIVLIAFLDKSLLQQEKIVKYVY